MDDTSNESALKRSGGTVANRKDGDCGVLVAGECLEPSPLDSRKMPFLNLEMCPF